MYIYHQNHPTRAGHTKTEIQHFQQKINEFYDQYLCPPVCRMHLSETSFDIDYDQSSFCRSGCARENGRVPCQRQSNTASPDRVLLRTHAAPVVYSH